MSKNGSVFLFESFTVAVTD